MYIYLYSAKERVKEVSKSLASPSCIKLFDLNIYKKETSGSADQQSKKKKKGKDSIRRRDWRDSDHPLPYVSLRAYAALHIFSPNGAFVCPPPSWRAYKTGQIKKKVSVPLCIVRSYFTNGGQKKKRQKIDAGRCNTTTSPAQRGKEEEVRSCTISPTNCVSLLPSSSLLSLCACLYVDASRYACTRTCACRIPTPGYSFVALLHDFSFSFLFFSTLHVPSTATGAEQEDRGKRLKKDLHAY